MPRRARDRTLSDTVPSSLKMSWRLLQDSDSYPGAESPVSATESHAVCFAALQGIEDIAMQQGQEASLQLQQRALECLFALCREYHGEIGNVVGGEVLCLFPHPDAALNAACRMQHVIHEDPEIRYPGLSLVVGMHLGAVHRKDTEVFGDSINTAARVKAEAQPGQILMSREMSDALEDHSARLLQPFDRLKVKGKARALTLMQVTWNPADLNSTSVMASMINSGYLKELAADVLELTLAGERRVINSGMTPVTVGRSGSCELHVRSQAASRLHCRIDHRRGKFVLIDESTNGTHLIRSDGSETILRREEAVLTGSGTFALGEPAHPEGRWTVHFATH